MDNVDRVVAEFEKVAAAPHPEFMQIAREAISDGAAKGGFLGPKGVRLGLATAAGAVPLSAPAIVEMTRGIPGLTTGDRMAGFGRFLGGRLAGAGAGAGAGVLVGGPVGALAGGIGGGMLGGSLGARSGRKVMGERAVARAIEEKLLRLGRGARTAGKIGLGVAGAGAAALLAKKLLSSGDED